MDTLRQNLVGFKGKKYGYVDPLIERVAAVRTDGTRIAKSKYNIVDNETFVLLRNAFQSGNEDNIVLATNLINYIVENQNNLKEANEGIIQKLISINNINDDNFVDFLAAEIHADDVIQEEIPYQEIPYEEIPIGAEIIEEEAEEIPLVPAVIIDIEGIRANLEIVANGPIYSEDKLIIDVVGWNNDQIRYLMTIIANVFGDDKNAVMSVSREGEAAMEARTYMTLNNENLEDFLAEFEPHVTVFNAEDSWRQWVFELFHGGATEIMVERGPIVPEAERERRRRYYDYEAAGFFSYLNKTHYDLSKYGIYHVSDSENYKNNCLHDALKEGGLDKKKLNEIKLYMRNRKIPLTKLEELCKKLNICINITSSQPCGDTQRKKYGKNGITYEVAVVDHHFFVNEKTIYTQYSIEKYNEISNLSKCNEIYAVTKVKERLNIKRSQDRFIDSFKLVKLLIEHKDKLLSKLKLSEELMKTQYFDKNINDEIDCLDYIVEDIEDLKVYSRRQKIFNNKIKAGEEPIEDADKYVNIYFDFETDANCQDAEGNQKNHLPYGISLYDEAGNKLSSFGQDKHGTNWRKYALNSLTYDNVRLIAHNAGYDFRFMFDLVKVQGYITKGNRLMSASVEYYNSNINKYINIQIKNSQNLINMALRKFPETFDKDYKLKRFDKDYMGKEVMPYKFYTQENLKKRWCKISEAKKFIKEEDNTQFDYNIERWNLKHPSNDTLYNIEEYSMRYCEIDCKLLAFGYNTFNTWMKTILNMDINNYCSIASLAHDYLVEQGCYEGVYHLTGIPQVFISRCQVGGRTMTCENKKYSETNEELDDFDGVSLYPSAMARIKGILKGLPKVIKPEELNINFLKDKDGYFIKIKITKIGKNRKFPLISEKDENGVRNFNNDMVGKCVYVDNIALEDLLQFQDVEYEVVQGYYFNEGFNNKINTVMKYLFNERNKFKKEGNPAQMIFKEIMNSSYGKTILKPIDHEIKIFNTSSEFITYFRRHYNFIKEYVVISGDPKTEYCQRKVTVIKPIDIHKNIPHAGVQILSMSKRIMNEVMCLAEDNDINIYYQDTDSMHIEHHRVNDLADLFREKYNRELIGKDLGQFHSDFADWTSNDEEELRKNPNYKGRLTDIISVNSIFLGKKAYIDQLRGTNKEGEYEYSYHARLKGINEESLELICKRDNINLFQLYERLANNEEISCDLACGGEHVIFKLMKNLSIKTINSMERKIKFIGDCH